MQQVSVVYVQLHNPSSPKLCQSSPKKLFLVFMTFLLWLDMDYAVLAEESAFTRGLSTRTSRKADPFQCQQDVISSRNTVLNGT